jgi:hypothetical protein
LLRYRLQGPKEPLRSLNSEPIVRAADDFGLPIRIAISPSSSVEASRLVPRSTEQVLHISLETIAAALTIAKYSATRQDLCRRKRKLVRNAMTAEQAEQEFATAVVLRDLWC